MADILPSLLTFPPDKKVSSKEYDKQATDYVSELGKVPPSTWTKGVNKNNILDLLNPAVNTLPYLFGLLAQCQAAGKDRARNEEAVTRSVIFFTSFDPIQVRYAGEHWRSLLEWSFDIYPKLGVRDFTPLTTAMLRLDPTAGTFTTSHLRLLRLCLDCGVPSQALPILDKNIYAYPQTPPKPLLPDDLLCEQTQDLSNSFITTKTGFSLLPLRAEYILEYYLSGAYIYIGLRNFARARLFLEYVILTPSSNHACSGLQVEAYKKWILIGLLSQGKSYSIPRTHDAQVMRSIRSASKAYEALADAFEKRDWRKYQAEMDVGVQIWHEDGNLRLVKEAGDNALLRFRVIDLQKTFAALPVSRVAGHVNLPANATLQMLAEMLRQGYLNGSITQPSSTSSSPVLHFNTTTTTTPSSSSSLPELDLQSQNTRLNTLISHIRDADRRLQLTKEYVEYQKRSKRGAAAAGSGGEADGDLAEQMDLTWDVPIAGLEEEDDEGDGDGGVGDREEGDGTGDEDIMAA